jgi:peptidoglycan/xylan/chitin deacetylase (PgdA/CDA1 family)
MRSLALCYHDIVHADPRVSGFTTPGAATYKLPLDRFQEHLRALESCRETMPFRLLITFDDGGCGAMWAADALEAAGHHGVFFITTGFLGATGFLQARQVSELHARGHVIGSHGATHRGRMNRMPEPLLAREWNDSVQALAALTGAPVQMASVPSGFYARRVAKVAAAAGIRQLFTQQPTTRIVHRCGCDVLGRFTVRSWTPASRVAALARGDLRPRFEQAFFWRLRQITKSLTGGMYGDLRRVFLARRSWEASARP